MRVGIHSGAVTAGVLRGEKSRFQLFGDTVNTAARMESTGERTKIQVSSETASLLMGAGKAHWVIPREEKIVAKGKGELQTYWLDVHSRRRVATPSEGTPTDVPMIHVDFVEEFVQELEAKIRSPSVTGDDSQVEGNDWDSQGEMPDGELGPDSVISDDIDVADDRMKRLVGWSVDVLQNLLKRIVAMRDDEDEDIEEYGSDFEVEDDGDDKEGEGTVKQTKKPSKEEQIEPLVETSTAGPARTTVLEEVKEIITLPSQASKYKRDPSTVRLSCAVVSQLERYVSKIANMYPDNSFHNFEHASHVTQSVTKLLARVVTPDCTTYGSDMSFRRNDAALLPATQLHEYTYGITSDPLTQFACAFSARTFVVFVSTIAF
jgi:Adenylate and Guanylate cyclase catalytic domain